MATFNMADDRDDSDEIAEAAVSPPTEESGSPSEISDGRGAPSSSSELVIEVGEKCSDDSFLDENEAAKAKEKAKVSIEEDMSAAPVSVGENRNSLSPLPSHPSEIRGGGLVLAESLAEPPLELDRRVEVPSSLSGTRTTTMTAERRTEGGAAGGATNLARVATPGAYAIGGISPSRADDHSMTMTASSATGSGIAFTQSRLEALGLRFDHAVAVDEVDVEDDYEALERAREEILANAVTAEVVEAENGGCCVPRKSRASLDFRTKKRSSLLAGLAVIGAVVGLSVGLSKSGKAATTVDSNALPVSTVAAVMERGSVRCGVDEDGEASDFYIDLCRAVSAATFGNPDFVEKVDVSSQDRFQVLASGGVDLLVRGDSHTFQRDVYQPDTGVGFTFSTPVFYDGLRLAGTPFFVSCAENSDVMGDCSDLHVCVLTGTTWLDLIKSRTSWARVVETASYAEYYENLASGKCNVVAGEISVISEALARRHGYSGEYVVGNATFSKEPLAIVTRDGDATWSALVNLVVQGLLAAEEQNITQSTAERLPNTTLVGDQRYGTIRDVISAVGNYGELYDRTLQNIIPRQAINMLNTGETGLLYAHPFGDTSTEGPGPVDGGVLDQILTRGHLRCGILAESFILGNAESVDGSQICLDTNFCRAVAAAIFEGASDNADITNIIDGNDGFINVSANEGVDILFGSCAVLEKVVNNNDRYKCRELSVSQPYFYHPTKGSRGESHNLMTHLDDPQFSAFVSWVVAAIIYAEEEGIEHTGANKMPEVHLFGPRFVRMFRDVIREMGNYGLMYRENEGAVESMPPRHGKNMLNKNPYGPQHYPNNDPVLFL